MVEIAIIDDEQLLLKSLRIGLSEKGFAVRTFSLVKPFLSYLKDNEPDVVFLDLLLPDGYGLDVLADILRKDQCIPTIIITAHGDVPSAVRAMKNGAFDFIGKPIDLDMIKMLISKACKERRLVREVVHHRNRSHKEITLADIIGESESMKNIFAKVKQISQVGVTTVLLQGESGTGKDLLAKAIHNLSHRRDQPFIEINCAALPEQLLESELFGYERGAFTGAKSRKIGLVELADGGTLFLDEVGELPLGLQAKLLKFLETYSFRRVGGTPEIEVDLFIIASTNRDLETAVTEKSFRKDLYYRLKVVPITVPPLRHRGADSDLLVSHYLRVFRKRFKKPWLRISSDAIDAMRTYTWPGNVRELKNLLEQLVILSNEEVIHLDDLPTRLKTRQYGNRSMPSESSIHTELIEKKSLGDAVDTLEKEKIRRALQLCKGVKTKAAKQLGISRFVLLRKLKRYGNLAE
jgi:two-component system response regulator AtoC